MTRILVLSDTHLKDKDDIIVSGLNLLGDLAGYLRKADLILHAGDISGSGFYHDLLGAGNLFAVYGNMDVLPLQNELPERAIVECEGVRIGLLHGWGSSHGLDDRIFDSWNVDKPDVMIFGHSHRPLVSYRVGRLLFNPGSPTDPRGPYPSFGWIEIDNGKIDADIVQLPKRGEFP